jgi:NAD(P)-dependent dehydrogenase (short-subunit alcohol dehydrogenase family)
VPVVLVTGADTGIGRAIATRLGRDGWSVGFATRDRETEAEQAFAALRAPAKHWVDGDLADASIPARLVAEVERALAPLDALVNNAGVTLARPALDLTVEELELVLAVDVRAPFLLAQAAARSMRGRGGAIVNVTSVHEHVPRVGFAAYASAKAALGMLTRSLALELGAEGIRVNAVAPGVIATEHNEEAERLGREAVPLARAGSPEEVAALVAFLLGPEATYVSGASLLIDGGIAQGMLAWPRAGPS